MKKRRMFRIALAALALSGCGARFDTFVPPGAEEDLPPPRQETVFPQAHFVGAALPGFSLMQGGRLLSTFDGVGGVLVLAVADRFAVRDLVPWVDYVSRRYGKGVKLIPVINLAEEHWFKKFVLRGFIAGSAYTLYYGPYWKRRTDLPPPVLDWGGRVDKALGLAGTGPFIVVSSEGRIIAFLSGRAVASRVKELASLLDAEAGARRDTPPPDVPEPFFPSVSRRPGPASAPSGKTPAAPRAPAGAPAEGGPAAPPPNDSSASPAVSPAPPADKDVMDILKDLDKGSK